jgi:hypothetical protein
MNYLLADYVENCQWFISWLIATNDINAYLLTHFLDNYILPFLDNASSKTIGKLTKKKKYRKKISRQTKSFITQKMWFSRVWESDPFTKKSNIVKLKISDNLGEFLGVNGEDPGAAESVMGSIGSGNWIEAFLDI